jgi:hypothetical protein
MSNLSDRQQQLATDRFNKNLKTNPGAPLFEALVRDYELFGDAALKPSSPGGDDPDA